MKGRVEFAGPPPADGRSRRSETWQERLSLAKARPNEWARFAVKPQSVSGCYTVCQRAAKKMGGCWEIVSRGGAEKGTDRKAWIYFRYLGENASEVAA